MTVPLLLTKRASAAFVGISVSTFSEWVRKGLVPPPVKMPTCRKRWSRVDLERHVAAMPRAEERR